MKKYFLTCFALVFSFFLALTAQTSTSQGKTDLKSLQIEPLKPREPLNSKVNPQTVPKPSLPVAPTPTLNFASYFFPGLLLKKEGVWQGGDNLFNLSSNLGVYIKISKPENSPLSIDEEALKQTCMQAFEKGRINPNILNERAGMAPLPFFQFQILVYPIQDGYAASCEGKLFEQVFLKRIELDANMAFQAITWQRSTLIVSPAEKFNEQLNLSVKNISEAFVEVYEVFFKNR